MPSTDPQALVKPPQPRDFRSRVQKLQSKKADDVMKNLAALVVDRAEFEKLRKGSVENGGSGQLTVMEALQVEALYQILFVKWSWSGYKELMDRMCGKVPLVVARTFPKSGTTLDLDELSDEELNELAEQSEEKSTPRAD